MIISNKKFLLLLIINILLLFLGIYKQDIFLNNYSYYASFTKGYIYLLIVAVLSSILMYYATNQISNKKYAYIALFSFIISAIIPSTIDQSTLLANLHIAFAYIGFCLSIIFNVMNLRFYNIYYPKRGKYFIISFLLIIFLSLYFFLDNLMVTFISEFIYTVGTLLNNSFMFLNKDNII